MRRYSVQDLFSFRDGPYGGCFSPYSPLFRRSQFAEGNLSALRHLPYQGRLSALLIGELSALLTERFFQTMRRYTVQDLFSFRAALRDGPYEDPGRGHFLRAEGFPKRRCHFESVAAQRHLNPRRPATCGLPPAPSRHGKGTSPSTACINASSPSYWSLSYQWM